MEKKISFKEKLFNAKKSIDPISKEITNSFFKSKYFDVNKLLEGVDNAMFENRLLLTQPIIDNKVYSIIEDLDSDEKRESFLELKADVKPQDKGSEITYYRRYTLQSLLGLRAEDDDANKASKNIKQNDLKWLNKSDIKIWENVVQAIENKKVNSLADIRTKFQISKETEKELMKVFEQNI